MAEGSELSSKKGCSTEYLATFNHNYYICLIVSVQIMEYHYGIYITKKSWSLCDSMYNNDGKYYYIIVLASDTTKNRLSFFIKLLDLNEDYTEEFQKIEFGTPVFFTSEQEKIIDIYRLNKFPTFPIRLPNNDLLISYCSIWCSSEQRNININKKETDLMNSVSKYHLCDNLTNRISHTSTDEIESIIQEEREIVESYDIDDIINELQICHGSHSKPTTESCEEYSVAICRNFRLDSKYYNESFDDYLNNILKIGCEVIEEGEIWLSADKYIKSIIDKNPINVEKIKEEIKQKYSRKEHLDFRFQNRLFYIKFSISRLARHSAEFLEISPSVIYKHLPNFLGTKPEIILANIKNCNKALFDKDKDLIYSDLKIIKY